MWSKYVEMALWKPLNVIKSVCDDRNVCVCSKDFDCMKPESILSSEQNCNGEWNGTTISNKELVAAHWDSQVYSRFWTWIIIVWQRIAKSRLFVSVCVNLVCDIAFYISVSPDWLRKRIGTKFGSIGFWLKLKRKFAFLAKPTKRKKEKINIKHCGKVSMCGVCARSVHTKIYAKYKLIWTYWYYITKYEFPRQTTYHNQSLCCQDVRRSVVFRIRANISQSTVCSLLAMNNK